MCTVNFNSHPRQDVIFFFLISEAHLHILKPQKCSKVYEANCATLLKQKKNTKNRIFRIFSDYNLFIYFVFFPPTPSANATIPLRCCA